jgi:hypothetical protein
MWRQSHMKNGSSPGVEWAKCATKEIAYQPADRRQWRRSFFLPLPQAGEHPHNAPMPDQPKPASRSDYLGCSIYAQSLRQRIERAIEKDITAGEA